MVRLRVWKNYNICIFTKIAFNSLKIKSFWTCITWNICKKDSLSSFLRPLLLYVLFLWNFILFCFSDTYISISLKSFHQGSFMDFLLFNDCKIFLTFWKKNYCDFPHLFLFRFLHSNQITTIPTGSFTDLPKLKRLWVILLIP